MDTTHSSITTCVSSLTETLTATKNHIRNCTKNDGELSDDFKDLPKKSTHNHYSNEDATNCIMMPQNGGKPFFENEIFPNNLLKKLPKCLNRFLGEIKSNTNKSKGVCPEDTRQSSTDQF